MPKVVHAVTDDRRRSRQGASSILLTNEVQALQLMKKSDGVYFAIDANRVSAIGKQAPPLLGSVRTVDIVMRRSSDIHRDRLGEVDAKRGYYRDG